MALTRDFIYIDLNAGGVVSWALANTGICLGFVWDRMLDEIVDESRRIFQITKSNLEAFCRVPQLEESRHQVMPIAG